MHGGPLARRARTLVVAALVVLLATVGMPVATATAQTTTTYWLGRTTDTEYVYDTKLPADFAALLTCDPTKYPQFSRGFCSRSTETVGGREVNLVRTQVGWDGNAFAGGTLSIGQNGALGGPGWWQKMDTTTPEWTATAAQVTAQATGDAWKRATLAVYVSQDADPAPLRIPIPELTLIQTAMATLGKTVGKGAYYPAAAVPVDLAGMRAQILAYGNAGRRDPDFRKKSPALTAKDLGGPTVVTKDGATERVYKQKPTPPYFADHVLNAKLNEAAQFQAEYLAANNRTGHTGPADYTDPVTKKIVNMTEDYQRVAYFGGPSAVEAAGKGGLEDVPRGWMSGDTHFRPWFNVDGWYPEIGYGIAQAADKSWRFVALAVRRTDEPTPTLATVTLPVEGKVGTSPTPGQSTVTVETTPPSTSSVAGPANTPPPVVAQEPAAPAVPAASATLCAQDSFGGPCLTTTGDVPDLGATEVLDNTLSSVRVPAGSWVSLYSDTGFRGACQAFSADQATLYKTRIGPDQVSSAKVTATAPSECSAGLDVLTLCKDDDFTGLCTAPTADVPDLAATELGAKSLSSARIPAGTFLSVYRETDYKGDCQSFSADTPSFGRTRIGGDQAASVKVAATRPVDCAEA